MTAITSFRDRAAERRVEWGGRPTLVAVAAMNALTGLMIAAVIAPLAYGQDADFYRSCALSVIASGGTCGSLYPPLVAIVARPLTWVSPTTAGIVMTLIGIATLMIGVALETRGRVLADRVLVAVAALGFAPVVYELVLGQVTLLIAAALYPVARRADAYRNGVPLGIALALAPKPLLLPVLFWMLIRRRRALAMALLTGAALTAVGLALAGPEQYRQWLSVLTGVGGQSVSGTLALSLSGNFSIWPLNPAKLALAVGISAVTVWAILRHDARGFVAALLAGLLLAPYTGLYAASILLLAVTPALIFAPRATRVLALIANPVVGFLLALPGWCLAALAACIPLERPRSNADASGESPQA